MILDLRATKAAIDAARTRVKGDQERLTELAKMMREKIRHNGWDKEEDKNSVEAAEFATRFDSAVKKLGDVFWEFYSISTRLDELIKLEDKEKNSELEKLKAEIKERDEQNCELKRRLKELEGNTDAPEGDPVV